MNCKLAELLGLCVKIVFFVGFVKTYLIDKHKLFSYDIPSDLRLNSQRAVNFF